MNEAFTFYGSFYDAICELEDADRLAVYDAICSYGITGVIPELSGVAAMAFKLMRPNIDANLQKRAAGKKGGVATTEAQLKQTASTTEAQLKQTASTTEAEANQQNITEQNKTKTKQEKESKRFAPPSPEQVRDYCQEKGIKVDPDSFVDFYAAKGWKVGSQPMKDWKAAVRTWSRRDSSAPPGRKYHNRYNDFPQRQYTSDEWKKIEHDWIMRDFGK